MTTDRDIEGLIENAVLKSDKIIQAPGLILEDYLAIAKVESALKPDAKAKTSSASGLFQFTSGTWRAMYNKYGVQKIYDNGVTKFIKDYILDDPFDAFSNAFLGALLTKENFMELKKIGVTISRRDIYLAHFSGIVKAKKVISGLASGMGDWPASTIYSELEINSNASIFFDKKTKKLLTLREVYEKLTDKVVNVYVKE